jgi:hypothetical protein
MEAIYVSTYFGIGPDNGNHDEGQFAIGPEDDDPPPEPKPPALSPSLNHLRIASGLTIWL